jgi:hypothetical protein
MDTIWTECMETSTTMIKGVQTAYVPNALDSNSQNIQKERSPNS